MDKRWIGIIIILIAGLGCMYLIVSNSPSVGNAVTVISDVTISIPDGFSTTESKEDYCVIFNQQTNETVRIKCLQKGGNYIDQYNSQLKTLKKYDDIIIAKNFTNKTLSMIEYENQSSNDKKDIKLVFFDKCNHTFSMKMEHFSDDNSKENVIKFIIENIIFDFKQNKNPTNTVTYTPY